jgi:hypothetical protein
VALRGDHDERALVDVGIAQVQRGEDAAGVGVVLGHAALVHDDGAPPERARHPGQGSDGG